MSSSSDKEKLQAPSSHQERSESITAASNNTSIGIDLLTPHADPSNPFAFTATQLSALVDPKNIQLLSQYGGLDGVARGLHANTHQGLCPDDTISTEIGRAHV